MGDSNTGNGVFLQLQRPSSPENLTTRSGGKVFRCSALLGRAAKGEQLRRADVARRSIQDLKIWYKYSIYIVSNRKDGDDNGTTEGLKEQHAARAGNRC